MIFFLQLMHCFEINIRICQPENSDAHVVQGKYSSLPQLGIEPRSQDLCIGYLRNRSAPVRELLSNNSLFGGQL